MDDPIYAEPITADELVELERQVKGSNDAVARLVATIRQSANWDVIRDGTRERLQKIGERYQISVISNADGRVQKLLEDAGLGTHLEFILDSALVGVEKPDPRIFLAATVRLGLPPPSFPSAASGMAFSTCSQPSQPWRDGLGPSAANPRSTGRWWQFSSRMK